jgi:hypothetical protein
MATKGVWFALRVTVLVQGHDTGHTASIFRGHGVVAEQDGTSINRQGLLLTQDEDAPTMENPVRLHAEERKKWSKAT